MIQRAEAARMVTVGEAAKELGVAHHTVQRWCREGMVGEQDQRTGWWFLSPEEVKHLKKPENRPRRGRPPKDDE